MELFCGDCLEVLPSLDANSVDLVLTDPPYFKVKNEAWDRQWDKPEEFLAWLGRVADGLHRVLKPNGSLYMFASPQMSARVECLLSERFNILNNIRWVKDAGWHMKAKKEALRAYLSPWEAIIFAEHYGSDNIAKGEAGYSAKCDELRGGVFEPLRAYLDGERKRAGIGKDECNEACGFSRTPGGMASRHYFSRSQWCLPTAAHYAALQRLFNRRGGDYLRRDYDDLRRDYDDLRREYEQLRRPFAVTAAVQHTDTWDFKPVPAYTGKHPCEKPQDLLRHCISASSREGGVVLDCFMGRGSCGEAALQLGRDFIGIEMDADNFAAAEERISRSKAQTIIEFPGCEGTTQEARHG